MSESVSSETVAAVEPETAAFLCDPAFVEEHVLRGSAGREVGDAEGCRARLVDVEDSTKITAEYTLRDGTTLFAKAYSGTDEDGAHSFAVMRGLWASGFGSSGRYRICEPLAYLPERRVLVTRGVPGVSLDAHLGTNGPEQLRGMHEAARWLARLHTAPVRVGPPWLMWRSLLRLAERLARAAERRPEHSERLRGMLKRLSGLAESAGTPVRLVQSHGQFRDLHVFVEGDTVSVIDFDRSFPSDPARDLEEFLHRLRWKTFKHTRRGIDGLARAFLESYVAEAPEENLTALPFYRACHSLSSLARHVRTRDPSDPEWEEVVAFHTAEFDDAAASGRKEELP